MTCSETSPSVFFASWHFYLDQSNGASISTRAVLLELARRGWQTSTLCGFAQDYQNPQTLDNILSARRCTPKKSIKRDSYIVTSFNDDGIKSLALVPERYRLIPTQRDVASYLCLLKETLACIKPDLLISYGGFSLGARILETSRRVGLKNAVFLHNLAYYDVRYFRNADCVFVPSRYAADIYRSRLGLETIAIPPLIASSGNLFDSPEEDDSDRNYVLFVNPELGKGVRYFIALAKECWLRRPGIRFLVAEGRAGRDSLLKHGKKLLQGARNIDVAANTENIDELYRRARIVIVPSLYCETFCRVAAEAIQRGVPVIASKRGATPEVVGAAGILLEIPDKYTPESNEVPTSDEISPWVETVLRLWDNASERRELRRRGIIQSKKWAYDDVANAYERSFRALIAEKLA